jgi:putative heme transporter
LVIPKIVKTDPKKVWDDLTSLSPAQLAIVVLATVFNLFTYWWQMMAAMPGLTTAQAAVNNQTTTTISNILPGGGAIAVATAVKIFRSWGFPPEAITFEITLTGIWNSFLKLGLPVIALALVAMTGNASAGLLLPAVVGLAILVAAIVLFALLLSQKRFARSIGAWAGRVWSKVRTLVRRAPVTDWGDRAVRFRHDTNVILGRRWLALTATTVVSHLALYLVLLIAVREIGISNGQIGWAQILAIFAFGRLVTAAPLLPGGVGLVEAAYITGLKVAGSKHGVTPAQILAAVVLFRALTYGIQIPLGGVTYLIWRANKRWRKPAPEGAGRTSAVAGRTAL